MQRSFTDRIWERSEGMSEEAFQIVKNMDMDEIRTRVAVHCAPLLAGVKISNLLTVPKTQKKTIIRMFARTHISICTLWESEEKVTFLLYEREMAENYLNQKNVKNLMERLGYRNMSLQTVLERVGRRYTSHMENGGCFPHEIGLLLGYPPEDVEGFMIHQGKNFLYAGYWKVYGDPLEAEKTFRLYDRAQSVVMAMADQGSYIRQILDMCRKIGVC